MKHTCEGCLFKHNDIDMGAVIPICTRFNTTYADSIIPREKTDPCKWHITLADVIKLQEGYTMQDIKRLKELGL